MLDPRTLSWDDKLAFFFHPPEQEWSETVHSTLYLLRREVQDCLIGRVGPEIEVFRADGRHRLFASAMVMFAGFDLLAWRLHRERPEVRFFELDHPATQAPKKRKLDAAGNLTFLPVDLATDSPATT
ncbi:MAG: class I SAM-dependent methyltransferase, partial [Vicinamibacterales bacterium]